MEKRVANHRHSLEWTVEKIEIYHFQCSKKYPLQNVRYGCFFWLILWLHFSFVLHTMQEVQSCKCLRSDKVIFFSLEIELILFRFEHARRAHKQSICANRREKVCCFSVVCSASKTDVWPILHSNAHNIMKCNNRQWFRCVSYEKSIESELMNFFSGIAISEY